MFKLSNFYGLQRNGEDSFILTNLNDQTNIINISKDLLVSVSAKGIKENINSLEITSNNDYKLIVFGSMVQSNHNFNNKFNIVTMYKKETNNNNNNDNNNKLFYTIDNNVLSPIGGIEKIKVSKIQNSDGKSINLENTSTILLEGNLNDNKFNLINIYNELN
ncbi:hypothetical protein RB653_003406 [Dictyostelium firmibasis]|uniref:Uncharacterized protein n=1 Tax=Dictyostelium firmibasis TaxID=79012 RepID=A0AAN7U4L4_9MYCE